MPRRARAVLPGFALHIVQRGINGNPCFLQPGDFAAYLGFLAQFSAKFSCAVHAYCLMTNHVHLLATPGSVEACGLLMKNLSQCYVQWLNHRLGRSGTLWEGRFHSCLVNSDNYVLACYRYIELNPVRAGMVAAAGQYRWSSYSANADGVPSDLVTAHAAYDALATRSDLRARAYQELCLDAPPPLMVEEIRKATRIGCVVGKRRRTPGRPAVAK
jgi:putative transposase